MFQSGNNLGKGRPPGARNKSTIEFLEILSKENFCAASALIECYREAKKTYDNYGSIYDAISDQREKEDVNFPLEDHAHKYLKIAADIAKDLVGYSYPKLKSIEQRKTSSTEGMTLQERLETAKLIVQALELEIKNGPDVSE